MTKMILPSFSRGLIEKLANFFFNEFNLAYGTFSMKTWKFIFLNVVYKILALCDKDACQWLSSVVQVV